MEKLVGFEKFVIILENIKYLRTWPTLEWLLWLSVLCGHLPQSVSREQYNNFLGQQKKRCGRDK